MTMTSQIIDNGDKVGIGIPIPSSKLDVNGNIQISNASIPMGLMTEVGGTTPLLNLSLNFREPNKNINFIGGGFRIDARDDMPLFQWLSRKPGGYEEKLLMTLLRNGYVGIGTISPAYMLDVIGTIRAREIKVDLNGADFVFESSYKLMPLNELEKFTKEHKHLPEIASAKEMEKNGTDLGVLASKLLQKIEELTLYTIEQNKKIIELEKQNKAIEELKQMVKLQNEKIEKIIATSK
jgi:hypothetical protein